MKQDELVKLKLQMKTTQSKVSQGQHSIANDSIQMVKNSAPKNLREDLIHQKNDFDAKNNNEAISQQVEEVVILANKE